MKSMPQKPIQPTIKAAPAQLQPQPEIKKPEALIQVSKQKAIMLLEGLNKIVNKNDPVYIELNKELNEVIKYWELIETIEIKKSKSAMDQLRQSKRTLTGEAAKQYVQRKNSR